MILPLPPSKMLEIAEKDGFLLPRWMTARDEGWVDELLATFRALGGITSETADDTLRARCFQLSKRYEVPFRAVAFAAWVARKRFGTAIDAALPPERVRDVVFEVAATANDRDEALAVAAVALALSVADVERSLFADRARHRVLVAPMAEDSPQSLVDRCNVTMLAALLTRSTEVTARFRADAAVIAHGAKRLGLLATFDAEDDTTTVTLSGPLSVFHDTTKYGRALAAFVPFVASARTTHLSARVVMPTGAALLVLDTMSAFGDTLPAAEARKGPCTARLRAAAAREGWALAPFVGAVHLSRRVIFPDLAMARGGERVLVEVVPYWTPEFLAGLLAAVKHAPVPIVVCVDETRGALALDGVDGVVPFRGVIAPSLLVSACEQALSSSSARAASRAPPPALLPAERPSGGGPGA